MRGRRHLVLRYGVGELRFSTTYWYDDVDFVRARGALRRRRDAQGVLPPARLRGQQGGQSGTDEIDAGPYDDLVTDSFWNLWETLFHNVWGVWRLGERPARLPAAATAGCRRRSTAPRRSKVDEGKTEAAHVVRWRQGQPRRCGCSSGQGSTTTRSSTPTPPMDGASLSIGWSTRLVAHCRPRRVHRAWVLDDAAGRAGHRCPIRSSGSAGSSQQRPSARTGRRCRSPSSTGSPRSPSAITRSTDEHNLVWDRDRRRDQLPVGDERGSRAAAARPTSRPSWLANLTMFHLLRPIYDINVFAAAPSRPRRGAEHALVRPAEAVVLSLRQVPLRVDELRRLAPARDCGSHVRRQPLRPVPRTGASCARCSDWRATSRPTAWAR